jgi:hypothetical protein
MKSDMITIDDFKPLINVFDQYIITLPILKVLNSMIGGLVGYGRESTITQCNDLCLNSKSMNNAVISTGTDF